MSDDGNLVKTLRGAVQRGMEEKLRASFCLAGREERRARLRAIMELSMELERIRAESLFGTDLAELVIEDVIEGDWRAAYELGMHFTFGQDKFQLRAEEVPRWARFVEIVRTECALADKRAKGEGGRQD